MRRGGGRVGEGERGIVERPEREGYSRGRDERRGENGRGEEGWEINAWQHGSRAPHASTAQARPSEGSMALTHTGVPSKRRLSTDLSLFSFLLKSSSFSQ